MQTIRWVLELIKFLVQESPIFGFFLQKNTFVAGFFSLRGSFSKSDLAIQAAFQIGSRDIQVSCAKEHCKREVEGWGRVPFSKKLMSPTPRRKWYLTTGRRAH